LKVYEEEEEKEAAARTTMPSTGIDMLTPPVFPLYYHRWLAGVLDPSPPPVDKAMITTAVVDPPLLRYSGN
jgi:hypothetical protein